MKNDIARLTAELRARYPEADLSKWSSDHDLDEEAFNAIVYSAVESVRQAVMGGIKEKMDAGEVEEVEETEIGGIAFPTFSAMVDIGPALANACAHCFIFGWEAAREYGG